MYPPSATDIIRNLAEGREPVSGEPLPLDNPCQHPHCVRALYAAVRAMEEWDQRARRKRSLPAQTGRPWTEDEEKRLVESHEAGTSLEDLAARHRRTRHAIEARLVKLGKIAPAS